ncbi:MAG TPA: hypothetical protein VGL53_15050 [Bryobacteraceae bacterium]|jgi:hypothetical protein
MKISVHVQIAGILLIALGLAHGYFERYFGWRKETAQLSVVTRQIFFLHCFFIAVVLILMGVLSAVYTDDILQKGPLGRAVCGALAVFWILRLGAQWFFYDPQIWRGSRFRTTMHWAFSVLWIYLAGTYTCAWWS